MSFRQSFVVWSILGILCFQIHDLITDDVYVFTGLWNGKIAYLYIALIEVIILECVFCVPKIIERRQSINKKKDSTAISLTPFLPDIPTEDDKYNRARYAELLVEKIITTSKELKDRPHNGSFNILLSECYGLGKSSFLLSVNDVCEKRKIEYITFRPWLCEDADRMVSNFFTLLSELFVDENHLRRLLHLYSEVVTSGVSNKLTKAILRFSKEDSLETLHDEISEELKDRVFPIVIAIDDVDRLQYKELVSLIKLIRNTADFPNIFYLIAADKNAICQMLMSEGKIQDPERYLQKFFNYEMMFPASESNTIQNLLDDGLKQILVSFPKFKDKKSPSTLILSQKDIRLNDIFHNPREVYKYLNLVSYELDNLNSELKKRHPDCDGIGNNDICLDDLLKVLLIRLLMPEIYKRFRDNRDLDFLDYYNGKLVLANKYASYFDKQYSRRSDGRNLHHYEVDFEGIRNLPKPPTETDFKSLFDIINDNKPSNEDIVLSIFRDLWSKERNVDSPSINKNEEFFRYFSGTWESNVATSYEVKAHITLPASSEGVSSIVFKQWLDKMVEENKMDSVIHKTDDIVRYRNNVGKHYDIIVNIVTCIRRQYERKGKNDKRLISDFYRDWDSTIKLSLSKKVDEGEDYYQQFMPFISHSKELELCALLMRTIRDTIYYHTQNPDQYAPCLFTTEQYNEMSEKLIDRIFSEIVEPNPYEEDTLSLHTYCSIANPKYWKNKFHDYLKHMKEPLVWLFGAFYWHKGTQLYYWNPNIVDALYDRFHTDESIVYVFENILPDIYRNDLKDIPTLDYNHDAGFDGKGNQLLQDVKEWQEKGLNPFPIPDWMKD